MYTSFPINFPYNISRIIDQEIHCIMIELFPLKYLIFKWWVFGAGLQLQLGGFGGMDYALRSTNPAPRSTNLGITKLGLSLPEFPRFLRPTIPASYVLWGKFSINCSCQTIARELSTSCTVQRLVIFTILLEWNFCLRLLRNLFSFLSLSLSRYGLSYSRLQHGPREVGKSSCRWSETCTMLGLDIVQVVGVFVAGFAGEIFFHRKLLYRFEYTCNTSSRNHSMEVCCSTGNYYTDRWNFTKLCWIFTEQKFFSSFLFIVFVGIRRID